MNTIPCLFQKVVIVVIQDTPCLSLSNHSNSQAQDETAGQTVSHLAAMNIFPGSCGEWSEKQKHVLPYEYGFLLRACALQKGAILFIRPHEVYVSFGAKQIPGWRIILQKRSTRTT